MTKEIIQHIKQFVETIKIKNGNAMALSYHQERMNRTMQHPRSRHHS